MLAGRGGRRPQYFALPRASMTAPVGRQEGCVTARAAERRTGSPRPRGRLAPTPLVLPATARCRSGPGGVDPTPTNIPQPTPDPTMAAVIQGHGVPVSYFPPLEV